MKKRVAVRVGVGVGLSLMATRAVHATTVVGLDTTGDLFYSQPTNSSSLVIGPSSGAVDGVVRATSGVGSPGIGGDGDNPAIFNSSSSEYLSLNGFDSGFSQFRFYTLPGDTARTPTSVNIYYSSSSTNSLNPSSYTSAGSSSLSFTSDPVLLSNANNYTTDSRYAQVNASIPAGTQSVLFSFSGDSAGSRIYEAQGYATAGPANAYVAVQNPSFEQPVQPKYAYPGYGALVDWAATGVGNTGVNPDSGNGSAFAPHGAVPDGSQFAFMQITTGDDKTISQVLTGLTPGAMYTVRFYTGHRAGGDYYDSANGATDNATLSVFAGGTDNSDGTVTGGSLIYQYEPTQTWGYFTAAFTADAASEELSFQGYNPTGDQTLALDDIAVYTDANFVPEPASLTIIAAGATLLLRRRRLGPFDSH
jgi:hypothetical protein